MLADSVGQEVAYSSCPTALTRTWSQGRWELQGRSGMWSLAEQLCPATYAVHRGREN